MLNVVKIISRQIGIFVQSNLVNLDFYNSKILIKILILFTFFHDLLCKIFVNRNTREFEIPKIQFHFFDMHPFIYLENFIQR